MDSVTIVMNVPCKDSAPTLFEVENAYIKRVLDECRGNKTLTAAVLGTDRRTLYRRLKKMGHAAHVKEDVRG